MLKTILFLSLNVLFFICTLNMAVGAELLIQDDFEAGSSWSYSSNWDLHAEYLADEWDIVTLNPHGGSYCAQSKAPGNLYIEDSAFHFSLNSDEVFIKFWAKFQSNINSANVGTNFFRYGTGASGNWSNGGEYDIQDHWLFIYSDKVRSPGISLSMDNAWHEYAFYMNFSTGVWRSWKDAKGNYTIDNAVDNFTDVTYAMPFTHILMPWFFKGDPGDYLLWMDDVEIWDGMPDSSSTPPPVATIDSPASFQLN